MIFNFFIIYFSNITIWFLVLIGLVIKVTTNIVLPICISDKLIGNLNVIKIKLLSILLVLI